MPVTVRAASGIATRRWRDYFSGTARSPEDLLKNSSPGDYRKSKTIIRSSFTFDDNAPISSLNNGLDKWVAILTQLSLYINAHAEELRSFFVAHEGQKELLIQYEGDNINTVSMSDFAWRMSHLLSEELNDPKLHPWIIPAFSTTTCKDRVVASVVMMGALQKYFSYICRTGCALPSVTLQGEQSDWEAILQRIEKLPQLGEEPTKFYDLLRPVLLPFVDSFQSPDSAEIQDFWQKIAHKSSGSGVKKISGWISAFCFWDENGKSLYQSNTKNRRFQLDGIEYHLVPFDEIPAGICSVPVTVDDNGKIYNTTMLAGSMGARITSTGNMLDQSKQYHAGSRGADVAGNVGPPTYEPCSPTGEPGLDSLQPESGWFMYINAEGASCKDDKLSTKVGDAEPGTSIIEQATDRKTRLNTKSKQKDRQDVAA